MRRDFENANFPDQQSDRVELTGSTRVHYFFYNIDYQYTLGYWEFLMVLKSRL